MFPENLPSRHKKEEIVIIKKSVSYYKYNHYSEYFDGDNIKLLVLRSALLILKTKQQQHHTLTLLLRGLDNDFIRKFLSYKI